MAGSNLVDGPDMPAYSAAVQIQAAKELERLPPACGRNLTPEGCSALGRLVLDYAWLREKVRALRGNE